MTTKYKYTLTIIPDTNNNNAIAEIETGLPVYLLHTNIQGKWEVVSLPQLQWSALEITISCTEAQYKEIITTIYQKAHTRIKVIKFTKELLFERLIDLHTTY